VDVIIKVGGVVHQRLLVMRERVIVMDLVMEGVMMDMMGVKEIFNVEATIAGSLVFISMRKMIVVKNLRPSPQCQTAMYLEHHWNLKKVKGVEGVIMSQVEDVVLQVSLVMRERVTVMVLMMVDNMMDMMAVKAL